MRNVSALLLGACLVAAIGMGSAGAVALAEHPAGRDQPGQVQPLDPVSVQNDLGGAGSADGSPGADGTTDADAATPDSADTSPAPAPEASVAPGVVTPTAPVAVPPASSQSIDDDDDADDVVDHDDDDPDDDDD